MTIPSAGGVQRGLAGVRDIASAWRLLVASKAAQPFLTYHDDTTGERVELSYATFDNWLAKTANLVQDDLMAGPGDRIAVCAQPHWLTAVWLVAPLLAGAVVDPWGAAKSAHTVVAGPQEPTLEAARQCPGERLALSLLPLGRPFDVVPDGFRDYAAEVRGFADRFASFNPPRPDMDALVLDDRTLTHAELVERALGSVRGSGHDQRIGSATSTGARPEHPRTGLYSDDSGVRPGDVDQPIRHDPNPEQTPVEAQEPERVLVDVRQDRFTGAEVFDWLFGPMLSGTAIVLVRGAEPQRLERIAQMERVTRRFTLG